MARKVKSVESVIVGFFATAPEYDVSRMLDVVNGIVSARMALADAKAGVAGSGREPKKKADRPRKAKPAKDAPATE